MRMRGGKKCFVSWRGTRRWSFKKRGGLWAETRQGDSDLDQGKQDENNSSFGKEKAFVITKSEKGTGKEEGEG